MKYFFLGLLSIIVGSLITAIAILMYKQIQRENKADILTPNNCIFLGHARDLNTVFFYDCNGEIIMRRIK